MKVTQLEISWSGLWPRLHRYWFLHNLWNFLAPVFWRRQWHPTPVLLPGKSHGRRSLEGSNPWGCEELDTTERLHFHFSLSCIGEGNGNPLQCSCLENPRERGAWLAAIHGVAQSWTRLKWLSSSSSMIECLEMNHFRESKKEKKRKKKKESAGISGFWLISCSEVS